MPKVPMKIVMIEDDPYEVQRFAEYFSNVDDMELVAAMDGASNGLEAVVVNQPDAVILDLELKEGSGILLLPKLKSLFVVPFVVVTTWTTDPTTLRNVRANGAGFVQPKSMVGYAENGPQMVAELLREMRPYLRETPVSVSALGAVVDPGEVKRRKVAEALGRISISAGMLSQCYLVDSILFVSQQEGCVVDMDNCVYPFLIAKYHVTRTSLEKAMRGRIERAWNITDPETLQREFTQYVNPKKGKPELHEFIGYYASRLI